MLPQTRPEVALLFGQRDRNQEPPPQPSRLCTMLDGQRQHERRTQRVDHHRRRVLSSARCRTFLHPHLVDGGAAQPAHRDYHDRLAPCRCAVLRDGARLLPYAVGRLRRRQHICPHFYARCRRRRRQRGHVAKGAPPHGRNGVDGLLPRRVGKGFAQRRGGAANLSHQAAQHLRRRRDASVDWRHTRPQDDAPARLERVHTATAGDGGHRLVGE